MEHVRFGCDQLQITGYVTHCIPSFFLWVVEYYKWTNSFTSSSAWCLHDYIRNTNYKF